MTQSTNPLVFGAMDVRVIAVMRLMLALLALLSTYVDPVDTTHYVDATYTVLGLYLCYSLSLCCAPVRQHPLLARVPAYWLDIGWYIALIGVSKGTNSIFFFFLFFAISVASFQWGFSAGFRAALVATLLFTSIGFAMAPEEPEFARNSFLLRPASLLVLGYMIACWGGTETTLRRRLALLKDVGALSNPRFGVDRTFGTLMERLRAFYDADTCLLVMTELPGGAHTLRRVSRHAPGSEGRAARLSPEVARLLLVPPPTQALVSGSVSRAWGWLGELARVQAYDSVTGARMPPAGQSMRAVLAAEAYITVPVRYRGSTVGRLYLTATRRRTFEASDIDFLLQVLEQTMPTIENIRLVDRLASDAAEAERQRIARDLHDSVIQPYIGLQMGLAAIQQKLCGASPHVAEDLSRLVALTNAGIAELRHYMGELRDHGTAERDVPPLDLLLAVRRFAGKFAEATGIAVQVDAATPLAVNDRLAAEVFHIVEEGLSNVRRHTRSVQATVQLTCHDEHFSLRIANDLPAGTLPQTFTPRSITERAAALGGSVQVFSSMLTGTVVLVAIPL
ncbi:MAG: GAF domain-containing sensor histidine kinase [Candidatus Tectimicrobiota bacterium]